MVNGGFTLVARFSNADQIQWMKASGEFWYSKDSYGKTTSTSHNGDMVNLAFSMASGDDIKVSRSDDNSHTALLLAPKCLADISMRSKITTYGDFR